MGINNKILAIVGSTAFADDIEALEEAGDIIHVAIQNLEPDKIISGGAKGIDKLGISLAQAYHIEWEEFLPKNKRWAPWGYKERNTLIAENCTHLLCIRHRNSTTYGSGWTADLAESFGKQVERYTI